MKKTEEKKMSWLALEEKERIDKLPAEERKRELQAIKDKINEKKKAREAKLALLVKALEPGRAGAGRVRVPTLVSVSSVHSNLIPLASY